MDLSISYVRQPKLMSCNPAFVAKWPWTFNKASDVFCGETSLYALFPIGSRVGENDEFL